MSGYPLRDTQSRRLAREMIELKGKRLPMMSRLTRANSGLRNIYLKSKATGFSRDEIEEEVGVLEQCEQVINPPKPGESTCWLCGFPIQGISDPSLFYSLYLDSAVCEHVLPVRLAGVITGLYYPKGGLSKVGDEHLLHSVYEYSHHLCNLAKSDAWFLSKPDKTKASYCDLIVNDGKINAFLENLYNYTVSPKGRDPVTKSDNELSLTVDRHESGIFLVKPDTKKIVRLFNNNIQYYIYIGYRKNEEDSDYETMKQRWIADHKPILVAKTERLIDKIKASDQCGTLTEGRLHQATMVALTELEQQGRIERLPGPSRQIFRRSPSINSIIRARGPVPRAIQGLMRINNLSPDYESNLSSYTGSSESSNNLIGRSGKRKRPTSRLPPAKRQRSLKSKGPSKKLRTTRKKKKRVGFTEVLKSFLPSLK